MATPSTSVSFFADLRKKFPSWAELSTFLRSAEGGRLMIVGTGPKVIIRYDKKTSDFSLPATHAFRSVIWDTVTNIPVSVAPFKASTEMSTSANLVQEFVEGVMLHAYQAYEDTNIHLSTRTKLGANTHFYAKRDFSSLVQDTPEYTLLGKAIPTPGSPEHTPYTFASLVLQHPEHRIVGVPPAPRIYIVSLGCVHVDGTVEILENPATWPPEAQKMAPTQYSFDESRSLDLTFANLQHTYGWQWQGLIIKNTTTLQRWRTRNPLYTPVRDLRGSEADSYARFLRLRSAGQLPLYLTYYPEESQQIYQLEDKISEQTFELFREYNGVHRGPKADRKSLKDVGWPLNNHVYKLHGLYTHQLKPAGLTLTLENVTQYVNALPTLKQRALLVTPVGGKVGCLAPDEVDMEV